MFHNSIGLIYLLIIIFAFWLQRPIQRWTSVGNIDSLYPTIIHSLELLLLLHWAQPTLTPGRRVWLVFWGPRPLSRLIYLLVSLLCVLHRLNETNFVLFSIRWNVAVIYCAHILDRNMRGGVNRAPLLHRAHPVRVRVIIRILGWKWVHLDRFRQYDRSIWRIFLTTSWV